MNIQILVRHARTALALSMLLLGGLGAGCMSTDEPSADPPNARLQEVRELTQHMDDSTPGFAAETPENDLAPCDTWRTPDGVTCTACHIGSFHCIECDDGASHCHIF
jgi:hypothetical protein